MERQPQVQSRDVCCCQAKTWALVIGWIQTIACAIALAACLIMLILAIVAIIALPSDKDITDEKKENTRYGLAIVIAVFVIESITAAAGLAAGICLIQGCKHEDAAKIKVWLIIEGIFFAFTLIGMGMNFWSGNIGGWTSNILTILINIFIIWVVNLYRKELLQFNTRKAINDNARSLM